MKYAFRPIVNLKLKLQLLWNNDQVSFFKYSNNKVSGVMIVEKDGRVEKLIYKWKRSKYNYIDKIFKQKCKRIRL